MMTGPFESVVARLASERSSGVVEGVEVAMAFGRTDACTCGAGASVTISTVVHNPTVPATTPAAMRVIHFRTFFI
jgi:microcystin degradation protein MlrC